MTPRLLGQYVPISAHCWPRQYGPAVSAQVTMSRLTCEPEGITTPHYENLYQANKARGNSSLVRVHGALLGCCQAAGAICSPDSGNACSV